jgi:hypothetical protein
MSRCFQRDASTVFQRKFRNVNPDLTNKSGLKTEGFRLTCLCNLRRLEAAPGGSARMFCECKAPASCGTSSKFLFWWGQNGTFRHGLFFGGPKPKQPHQFTSVVLQHHQFAIHRFSSGYLWQRSVPLPKLNAPPTTAKASATSLV